MEMKDKMNQIRMQTGCPFYDEEKQCWRVRFQDRPDEEGDLLYVVSEFIKSGLIYRYNVRQTQKQGINGHERIATHMGERDEEFIMAESYRTTYRRAWRGKTLISRMADRASSPMLK